jgi:hypothetical protein
MNAPVGAGTSGEGGALASVRSVAWAQRATEVESTIVEVLSLNFVRFFGVGSGT